MYIVKPHEVYKGKARSYKVVDDAGATVAVARGVGGAEACQTMADGWAKQLNEKGYVDTDGD